VADLVGDEGWLVVAVVGQPGRVGLGEQPICPFEIVGSGGVGGGRVRRAAHRQVGCGGQGERLGAVVVAGEASSLWPRSHRRSVGFPSVRSTHWRGPFTHGSGKVDLTNRL
jgi:hypothetical protein